MHLYESACFPEDFLWRQTGEYFCKSLVQKMSRDLLFGIRCTFGQYGPSSLQNTLSAATYLMSFGKTQFGLFLST